MGLLRLKIRIIRLGVVVLALAHLSSTPLNRPRGASIFPAAKSQHKGGEYIYMYDKNPMFEIETRTV